MAWTRDRIIFSSNIIRSLLLFRDYSIRDREDLSTRMNREEKLALLNSRFNKRFYFVGRDALKVRKSGEVENRRDPRRGAPSVTHQAPRFPLVQEQGPKTNKTSSTARQSQCLIDLRPTRALGKFTTENVGYRASSTDHGQGIPTVFPGP